MKWLLLIPSARAFVSVMVGLCSTLVWNEHVVAAASPQSTWDPPAIMDRPDHDAVAADHTLLDPMISAGRRLFGTRFNSLDGAGRPGATGDSKPTVRLVGKATGMSRVAGPDANSCAGCHNQPVQGGSGDFATNVFVGAHFTDPSTMSVDPSVTNERNTTSMFGDGAIEMVAREMTEDLKAALAAGLELARVEQRNLKVQLATKGVSFGSLLARPDGTYDPTHVEGVDPDLIVKPFGVKGVAVSLREFTVFALNQHHGMQAEERFGWARTGIEDFDADGVKAEFTVGQVSALTLYQASLPAPRREQHDDENLRELSIRGEHLFSQIGCSRCHIPALPLQSRFFVEPNPFNRPGTAVPGDLPGLIYLPLDFDSNTACSYSQDGQRLVRAFTDLKRHDISDDEDPHFGNERVPQDFVPTKQFLTARLWDVGTSAPYGHRGDLSTVSEAILHHAGEARAERTAFEALADADKRAIIRFLLSLKGPDSDSTAPVAKKKEAPR